MLGSNPGLWHWQPDAPTTWLDIILSIFVVRAWVPWPEGSGQSLLYRLLRVQAFHILGNYTWVDVTRLILASGRAGKNLVLTCRAQARLSFNIFNCQKNCFDNNKSFFTPCRKELLLFFFSWTVFPAEWSLNVKLRCLYLFSSSVIFFINRSSSVGFRLYYSNYLFGRSIMLHINYLILVYS